MKLQWVWSRPLLGVPYDPVSFAKFLRTPLQQTSGRLLLIFIYNDLEVQYAVFGITTNG